MDKMFLNKYESIIIVNPELKFIGDIKEKIFRWWNTCYWWRIPADELRLFYWYW